MSFLTQQNIRICVNCTTCCAAMCQVYIQSISYHPAGAPAPPAGEDEDETMYRGPPFDDLDPAVQESFHTYLEERSGSATVLDVCAYSPYSFHW